MQADFHIANRSDTWTFRFGSACTPRFPCISAIFECHTISQIYPSKTVRAHITRTYHRELERAWQFDITIPAELLWGLITHILVYLWGLLLAGGMIEKEITSLCYLPTFAWIFKNLSRALSCLRLSGHNFLVQRKRHNIFFQAGVITWTSARAWQNEGEKLQDWEKENSCLNRKTLLEKPQSERLAHARKSTS